MFILEIDDWDISCEITLGWLSLDFSKYKSKLVQQWLGAVKQQASTRANADPYISRHMASLGYNDLTHSGTARKHISRLRKQKQTRIYMYTECELSMELLSSIGTEYSFL